MFGPRIGATIRPVQRRKRRCEVSIPGTASADVLVETAMHPGVIACGRETPLSDVALMMVEQRVHAIIVFDGTESEPWGVVSDLDLAAAAGVRELGEQTAGASAATQV